ncbi:MAG: phage tail protein I [Alphaproteobacteria bacterium]|nr:phage tail protein I [Alphaproteobacteria bacterium]
MTEHKSILPPNSTSLLKDFEAASDTRFSILQDNPLRWLNNPDHCPEYILPWLGWALSVDVWNENWAVSIRRNVIKASVGIHRNKGTIGALKQALEAFRFDNVKVEEWFQYGGDPYMFKVFIEIVTEGFDINDLTEVYIAINQAKNARSHLESLRAVLCNNSQVPYIGSGLICGEIVTIHSKIEYDI